MTLRRLLEGLGGHGSQPVDGDDLPDAVAGALDGEGRIDSFGRSARRNDRHSFALSERLRVGAVDQASLVRSAIEVADDRVGTTATRDELADGPAEGDRTGAKGWALEPKDLRLRGNGAARTEDEDQSDDVAHDGDLLARGRKSTTVVINVNALWFGPSAQEKAALIARLLSRMRPPSSGLRRIVAVVAKVAGLERDYRRYRGPYETRGDWVARGGPDDAEWLRIACLDWGVWSTLLTAESMSCFAAGDALLGAAAAIEAAIMGHVAMAKTKDEFWSLVAAYDAWKERQSG